MGITLTLKLSGHHNLTLGSKLAFTKLYNPIYNVNTSTIQAKEPTALERPLMYCDGVALAMLMVACCGWLIAMDDCDPHRRRLRLALPLSKLGAGQTRVLSRAVAAVLLRQDRSTEASTQVLVSDVLLVYVRQSFALVLIHSFSHGYDGSRLVLVLFLVAHPRPPRCPFFSLGPAVPAPPQYLSRMTLIMIFTLQDQPAILSALLSH